MAKQTFTTGQVLTAAQMTSLQQTAMGGGSPSTKTASYVLVAADAGTVIQMNAAGSTTITVNTALFSAGDSVQIQNIGAGVCTITAGTATVNTAGSLALSQWEGGFLYFTSASSAIFFDVVQASGMTNPMTTTGDTIYSSSGSTPARLGIGSTGQVLTVAGGVPSWATPAAGGASFVGCSAAGSGSQTIATATFTAINFTGTDLFDTDAFHNPASNPSRMTIPAGKAGKYAFSNRVYFDTASSTGRRIFSLYKNGVVVDDAQTEYAVVSRIIGLNTGIINLAVGDYIEAYAFQGSGGNLDVYAPYCSFSIQYLGA